MYRQPVIQEKNLHRRLVISKMKKNLCRPAVIQELKEFVSPTGDTKKEELVSPIGDTKSENL